MGAWRAGSVPYASGPKMITRTPSWSRSLRTAPMRSELHPDIVPEVCRAFMTQSSVVVTGRPKEGAPPEPAVQMVPETMRKRKPDWACRSTGSMLNELSP